MKLLVLLLSVAAGAIVIYYYTNRYVDRFGAINSTDPNKCKTGCQKDCQRVCRNSPAASIPGTNILDVCVSVCEGGVASCMKKCDGCGPCS